MNRRCLAALAGLAAAAPLHAQTVDPFYAANYSIVDLGTLPAVPSNYGGLTFLVTNPNVMLLGGAANSGSGVIYRVDVVRDGSGNITGFGAATPVQYATAPYIDGGLTFGPLGVLFFTGYPVNTLGEIRLGSTTPDRTIDLNALGVVGSVGACMYVPTGFPGAGKFKIVSYGTSNWYTSVLATDGMGTFDVTQLQQTTQLSGGPEGVVYVPLASPQFSTPSILVSEYGFGSVASYNVDANGDPIVASRRVFISGLSGAEGAVIDPVTGQFLFSTFGGGSHVIVVRGFAPPPVCYANCDGSTTVPVLNINDFTCFQQRFASGDTYANCDGSTLPPVLNVNDFVCFQNRFVIGCP